MGRILGIDYGDRWFGLALSDPSATLATPLCVVEGEAGLREELRYLRETEEIERLVVGIPFNMDGSLGPKARQVLAFKKRLEEEWGLPVDAWDERLTTVEAEEVLRSSGLSAAKRRQRVDKVAAQILLQGYLDARKASSGGRESP